MRTALARQQESARQRRESAQPLTREMVHDFIEDFKPRFEGWQRKMGLMAGVCTFKLMKSRWGSCQPVTRDISINVRLAQYPPECTDYVIVHELAHILEANHSPAFWAIVARYMPDYQRHRARLKLPPDR